MKHLKLGISLQRDFKQTLWWKRHSCPVMKAKEAGHQESEGTRSPVVAGLRSGTCWYFCLTDAELASLGCAAVVYLLVWAHKRWQCALDEASCSQTVKWPDTFGTTCPDTCSFQLFTPVLNQDPCGLRCLLGNAPALLPVPLHFLRAAADLAFFSPPPRCEVSGPRRGWSNCGGIMWPEPNSWFQWFIVNKPVIEGLGKRNPVKSTIFCWIVVKPDKAATIHRSKASSLWLHQCKFGHSSRAPTNAGSSVCSLASRL